MQDLFLDQLIKEPTRHRDGQRDSILDQVLTDNSHFKHDFEFSNLLDESDQLCIFIYTTFDIVTSINNRFLYYRGDYDSINHYLCSQDWLTLFDSKTVQQCYDAFYEVVTSAVERFIP